MSRQYPHSDEIQPRFAAWLWSVGGDADPKFEAWAPKMWGYEFMVWIGANKRKAASMGMGVIEDKALAGYYRDPDFKIINHDDFTEACWMIADEQRASAPIPHDEQTP